MLDSIWQLLANYGLDVKETADAIHTLIEPVVDAEGNVVRISDRSNGMSVDTTLNAYGNKTVTITPYDATTLKAMEKAILASDIGITPTNDGKVIRLVFPQPTEERRREIAKQIQKMGEDAKVAIRNIRRDANDLCKTMKKNGEMTEDEQKASEKSIQDLTDKYTKEVDAVTAKKEKEIMQI